jgi:hypothetical protein
VSRLAQEVTELHERLREASDPTRRVGFRLDDIVGELRRIGHGLGETASDLARVRSSQGDSRLCQAEWGVCPDHGDTLTSSRGISQCSVDARVWGYDRLDSPCGEPVTDLVTDPAGTSTRMCHGHALAVPNRDGWRVRTFPTDTPGVD